MGKADRTRQHIIETVAPVFNRQGFAGTSISDLTKATGLTKGSIYGNFKDKEEVAACAFRHNVSRISDEITSAIRARKGYLNKLLAFPHTYRRNFRDIMEMGGCPVINTAVECDDTNRHLHALAVESIAEWESTVVVLVERGLAAGELRGDTDPRQVARLVISLVQGGGVLSKVTGDERYMFTCLDQVEQLLQSLAA